jgi:5-methylthioadenosine/S-adenosylhomocysteine deaminase
VTVVLRNGLVDVGDGRFERASIAVDGGSIAAVGAAIDERVSATVIDASRLAVVPGLINAHTHSSENWFRGRFDNLPLEAWLLLAYPRLLAPQQSEREIYLRTALGAMEMARTGTTCVVDFLVESSGHTEESLAAVVRAYRDVGVRALICIGMADRATHESGIVELGLVPEELAARLRAVRPPAAGECLALARRLVERFHRPEEGIAIGLAPSGPTRCTEDLLLGALEMAQELDLQVHAHTLETNVEAMAAPTVIGRLAEIGFLCPRVHLSHGVWMGDDDPARIAETGATVVHNPLSNLKLGSGVAPIPRLWGAGARVALGTDGVCTGDCQDLFQALKLAAILHKPGPEPPDRWLGAREAWTMATASGAAAAGAPDALGRIEPGGRADLTLLDLDDHAFAPLNDPLLQVVLQAPARAVRHVLVGGEWVVRDGALARVDASALLAEAREAAASVLERHGAPWELGGQLLPAALAARERALAAPAGGERLVHRS